jgi:hypothetical protein
MAASCIGTARPVASVTIPDHVVGRFIPRERIRELAGDPVCCRTVGNAQRDQPAPLVPQNDQDKQQPKADGRHDQEVHRADACRMIVQKGLQVCDRPRPRLAMYLATVDWATSIPSLSSSPWMRGAPQSRLARLISRISRRISTGTFGRPPRELDLQRQYSRKPVRCHRMTVAVGQ